MICFNWNCRRLGNPHIVIVLKWLIKDRRPNLVFLIETRCNKQKIKKIRKILQFDYYLSIDDIGKSGGLAMFWNQSSNVHIISYTRWHISAQWFASFINQQILTHRLL